MNDNKLYNRFISKIIRNFENQLENNKSLGNILKEKREKFNLSIQEVSKKTKIRPLFIKYIENEEFKFIDKSLLENYLKVLAHQYGAYEELREIINNLQSNYKDKKFQQKSILYENNEIIPKKDKKWQKSDFIFLIVVSFLAFFFYTILFEEKLVLQDEFSLEYKDFIEKQKDITPTLELKF